ncbi:MAG: hypothetical protein IJ188_06030 [Clostridia bacterium]|nr:hypothetical protein [Clostridia bacterium]MBQ9252174.1 hypothetical protein [Clostridia bacterium]
MRKTFLLALILFLSLFAYHAHTVAESILVISDTHLTRESQNHAAMMEAVIQAAKGTCLLMMDTNRPDKDHSFLPDGSIEESTLLWVQQRPYSAFAALKMQSPLR